MQIFDVNRIEQKFCSHWDLRLPSYPGDRQTGSKDPSTTPYVRLRCTPTQQNIFELSFWIDVGCFCQFRFCEPSSCFSKAGVVIFVVESLRARETSSEVKTRQIDCWIISLRERLLPKLNAPNWFSNKIDNSWNLLDNKINSTSYPRDELESPHLKSSDFGLLNIEKY